MRKKHFMNIHYFVSSETVEQRKQNAVLHINAKQLIDFAEKKSRLAAHCESR